MYLREVQCEGVYNILFDMINVQGQSFEKTLFSHSVRVGNTNINNAALDYSATVLQHRVLLVCRGVAEGKGENGGATEGDKDQGAWKWSQKFIAQLKNYFRPLKKF